MRLLVFRHAEAGSREEFARTGRPDTERPITEEGRGTTHASLPGLQRMLSSIRLIASSPLTRADQTARILATAFRDAPVVFHPFLQPESKPTLTIEWLRNETAGGVVAIVGHEPHLGRLVSLALSAHRDTFIDLEKGGACLVEFATSVEAGAASLLWLLQPRQMILIGRGSTSADG